MEERFICAKGEYDKKSNDNKHDGRSDLGGFEQTGRARVFVDQAI